MFMHKNLVQDSAFFLCKALHFYFAIHIMDGIEQLPPTIQEQGAEKIANWLTTKTGVKVTTNGHNLFVPSLANLGTTGEVLPYKRGTITTMGTWECATAIGIMIGTVGFPLSKITKLKKAIDLLGGVSKTVERIYSKYKLYKSWNYRTTAAWRRAVEDTSKTLSSDVKNAFLDFFNITNVIDQCT
ncbi:MAG: hypothetical protein WAW77_08860 [Caldibacillus thermoamylovorans]